MWHDCGSVCGLCRQADRALTSLSKHFYLFISAFGLRRFCAANLHNSLVLRGAWTPWYRYDEGAAHEGTQWLLRSLLKYHTGPWLSCIEFSHWSTSCHAEYVGGVIRAKLFLYHKPGLPDSRSHHFSFVFDERSVSEWLSATECTLYASLYISASLGLHCYCTQLCRYKCFRVIYK